jgi:hypothetical protein
VGSGRNNRPMTRGATLIYCIDEPYRCDLHALTSKKQNNTIDQIYTEQIKRPPCCTLLLNDSIDPHRGCYDPDPDPEKHQLYGIVYLLDIFSDIIYIIIYESACF